MSEPTAGTAPSGLGTCNRTRNVPLAAVVYEGKQAYVFVRNANNFEARPVTVTASAGQRVHIGGKLKAGENIAISGIVALKGAWLADKGDN